MNVLEGALVDEEPSPCTCWCDCPADVDDIEMRCRDCESGEHVFAEGGEG